MAFNISEFRANFSGLGARPTLFRVFITNPIDGSGDQKLTFTCKAASLPGANKGTIEVPYMGRKVKVAGDRTFEPWTVTIINDEDFLVRKALLKWDEAINGKETNINALSPVSGYKNVNASVVQYGKAGNAIAQYELDSIWPKDITPIELSSEQTDTIEEYQVTFEFDFWRDSNVDVSTLSRLIG